MTSPNEWVTVPLHSVAHGRAGDKGNRLNVSIVPYNALAFDALATQLTPEKVLSCLLYTSPSPRDGLLSRMPSSA